MSSMDGHIWRWAGNIPPGFEPEFEPRLAHYSKCYTYTWFGSALQLCYMENRFGAPASGTPEWSARREFELLLLLGGSRKAAVQLWLRKQRIYANAQQAAGRPATEAKGPREAAERQAGGESKPETAAQAARRHRSEHRLREKHLARKIWAAVRVRKHLSRWCERARAAVAKRPASSSTTSTAAAAPQPAPPPPPPAPDQAQARATPPAGAAAAASSAPDVFMTEGWPELAADRGVIGLY